MEYGVTEYVGLRLEKPLVKALDDRAMQMGIRRSDLIRIVLRERFNPIPDYAEHPSVDAEIVNSQHNLP